MADDSARVEKFSSNDLPSWMSDEEQQIQFGDVVDEDSGAKLDVTFIRWGAGERGEFPFPLPYDEVFVVTKGSFTVRTGEREVTAGAGEVLYLWAGISGEYFAAEDAEVVAVTYPPYRRALREAGHGAELDSLTELSTAQGDQGRG